MFLLKRNSLLLSGLLIFCLMATACTTVPITGRKQLAVIPAAQIQNLSRSQYDQFLKEHPLSKDAAKTRLVKRVGRQIQQAVEKYFADNNMSERLSGFEWEFNLVAADEVNAWAMPGGKVVVYEGILPLTEDAVGLAVVMGHEIAHVVARHGRERMSQKLLVQLGGMALETALKQNPSLT